MSSFLAADAVSFWQPVSWTTSDGVILQGLYHAPAQKGRLTWVLLHGLGSNKGEWESFAQAAAKTGQGIFVYDMRGHYQSQKTIKGPELNYQSFDREDWKKMSGDLAEAVDMLEKKFGTSSNSFGVGGASVGANVALIYAAANPKVKGLLLLSPGMEYAGLNIEKPYADYGRRPLCMAASPGDQYAYESVRLLTSRRTDAGLRVMEGPGSRHGVQMFEDPSVVTKIIDWMNQVEAHVLLS